MDLVANQKLRQSDKLYESKSPAEKSARKQAFWYSLFAINIEYGSS